MENSSYSKTRSPARFLAAFLAFVMVLIVMPVLPVGAVVKVTTIIFDNVVAYPEDENIGSNDVFYSDVSGTTWVDTYLNKQNESVKKWEGSGGTITANGEANKVTLTTTDMFVGIKSRLNVSFSFKVLNSNGKDIQFRCGSAAWKTLTANADGVYTIKNEDCESDATQIEIRAIVPPKTHTLTFNGPGATDYNITISGGDDEYALTDVPVHAGSQVAVTESTKYTLTIKGVPTAEKPNVYAVSSKANVGELKEAEGTYTVEISGVSANETIRIDKDDNYVKLTFDKSENPNFKVNVPNLGPGQTEATVNVLKGGRYSFTVSWESNYDGPEVTIKKADEEVSGDWTKFTTTSNGLSTVYELYDVDTDLQIAIGDNALKQSKVEYHLPEGATVKVGEEKTDSSQATSLTYGTHDIEITIPVAYSNSVVSATVNGVAIVLKQKLPGAEDGSKTYTGSITVNSPTTVIVVNGVQKNTYTVTIALSEKYTVQGNSSVSVAYGENAVFTLLLAEGYEIQSQCGVTFDGSKLNYSEDYEIDSGNGRIVTVTIKKITKNGTASFEDPGISLKKLKVSLVGDNKGKFQIDPSLPIDGETTVDYGSGISFSVTPKSGYRIKSVYWTKSASGANDARNELTELGGRYSLADVTADRYVHVDVEPINYTLKLHATQTTTTFDNQLGATKDGDVFTITFNADMENAKLKEIFTPTESGCEVDFSTLNKMITRRGYSLAYWKNQQNAEVEGKYTMQNSANRADVTVTFEPEWKINMETSGEGAGNDEGFFTLLMETFQFHSSNDKTTLRAKILTNLQPADQGSAGGVKMVAHGFLYANSEANMSAATGAEKQKALMKELKDAEGGNGHVDWLNSYTGKVLYYKRDTKDDAKQMFEEGRYSVTLTNTTGDENIVAVAWVIVEIDGEEYLFLSQQKKLESVQ